MRRLSAALGTVLALSACARSPVRNAERVGGDSAPPPDAAAGATTPAGECPDPLHPAPIVLQRLAAGAPAHAPSPDEANRRKVSEDDDAFWQEKIDAARSSAAAGDDRAGLELLACALALNPPPPWDARLKSVRVEIKSRHVDTDVLRVDARGDRDYVTFGSD